MRELSKVDAMMDPFSSHLPKYHPKRVYFKGYTILAEKMCSVLFNYSSLPIKKMSGVKKNVYEARTSYSVTDEQLDYLLAALDEVDHMPGAVIVEVGAYKGETTRELANHTTKAVFAVDKYFSGWGQSEEAYNSFVANTAGLHNVKLIKKTSAEAVREWGSTKAGLVFIDAQHDFVNTRFDIKVWERVLEKGGLLALHDIDQANFPGTRYAAYLASKNFKLWAHVDGLLIFQK